MYKVQEIAEYVIYYAYTQGNIVTNLKLQKILYYIQAEFLVGAQKQCFPERIEAWDFGPVIPEVYRRYKIYGGSFIPTGRNNICLTLFQRDDRRRIENVVDACDMYSTATLAEFTRHQTPYIEARLRYDREITPESIRQFFTEKEGG